MLPEDRIRLQHMLDAIQTAIGFLHNRLIHGDFDVDTEVVWRSVKNELPELASAIEGALQA